jgi:hypothetical protein
MRLDNLFVYIQKFQGLPPFVKGLPENPTSSSGSLDLEKGVCTRLDDTGDRLGCQGHKEKRERSLRDHREDKVSVRLKATEGHR